MSDGQIDSVEEFFAGLEEQKASEKTHAAIPVVPMTPVVNVDAGYTGPEWLRPTNQQNVAEADKKRVQILGKGSTAVSDKNHPGW